MKPISNKIKIICIVLIVIGGGLRSYHYLMSRSVWVDEAMVSLNIVNSPFSALVKPLQYNQLKPIGFMFVEKCFVEVFGSSEFALRAFPLLCGLLSLLLFYAVTKNVHDHDMVLLIALGLFIISDRLVHYSSEAQPYSSDVFFTLLLLWLYLKLVQSKYSIITLFFLLITGIVSVWISLPSAFILASIGGVWLYHLHQGKYRNSSPYLLLCGGIWLISFGVHYGILKHNLIISNFAASVDAWFQRGFLPLPTSPDNIRWYMDTFFSIFADQPSRLFLPGIASFCFVSGLVLLKKRRTDMFLLFFLPVAIALIASALGLYPFHLRWIIFLVPIFILFIADGLNFNRTAIRPHSKSLAAFLVFLFFLQPVACQIHRLMNPFYGEEIKPVLQFVRDNIQDGDQLYIYHSAIPAFKFYSARFGLHDSKSIEGRSGRHDLNIYIDDINRLKGTGKAWFVFSHVPDWLTVNEEDFCIQYLNQSGHPRKGIKGHGAAAYLYEL